MWRSLIPWMALMACAGCTTPAGRAARLGPPVAATPATAAPSPAPETSDDDEPPPRYGVQEGAPSPAFMRLTPREREQWHACRIFFLHRPERPTVPLGTDPRPPTAGPAEFTVGMQNYVKLPNATARRAFLLHNGCPEAIVDLADGTHLDLIEHP